MTKSSFRCACSVVFLASVSFAAQASAAEPVSDRAQPSAPDEERAAADGERLSLGLLGGVGFPRPLALEGQPTFAACCSTVRSGSGEPLPGGREGCTCGGFHH